MIKIVSLPGKFPVINRCGKEVKLDGAGLCTGDKSQDRED